MEPTISIPQAWLNSIAGALVALVGWLMRGTFKRIGDLETASKSHVTRDELAAALNKRDEFLASMHQQNLDNFREIRLQNESTNNKLFELARQKQP